MSESKKYLENFLYNYNNLFDKTADGQLILKNYDNYVDFLSNYGLINTNKDNYTKINFFKENVNELLLLPKNDKNSIWLLDNICKIKNVFTQIQTDHTVPDQGHYMYKNYEFKQGISGSGYLMHFLEKIENTENDKFCKFGEECKRCNPIHFKQFYHPRTLKSTNSPKTLKINKTTSKINRFNPYKNGGKNTRKNKNINKSYVKTIVDKFLYHVTKSNDAESLNKLFCNDGLLIATLSRKTRKKNKKYNMKNYFKYFANLKNIKILSKHYDIHKIDNNVYLNQATIKWHWKELDKPVIARMTFVIRNKCIYLLHSSSLPKLNPKIK
mgnify:CR=1 FL=1